MKNKYYTPDISEFYAGFEFELKNSSHKSNFEFEKCYFTDNYNFALGREKENDSGGMLGDVEFWLTENSIRVKYLDKEDIEELGFSQLKSPLWFHKENVSLFNSGVYDLRICLWPREDNIRISISYPSVDDEQIFVGKCKNKSELKQVLKMIGYGYNN